MTAVTKQVHTYEQYADYHPEPVLHQPLHNPLLFVFGKLPDAYRHIGRGFLFAGYTLGSLNP